MKKNFTFAGQLTTQGTMAEWLGNGLQNRLQRFESAWYLKAKVKINVLAFFFYSLTYPCHRQLGESKPDKMSRLLNLLYLHPVKT